MLCILIFRKDGTLITYYFEAYQLNLHLKVCELILSHLQRGCLELFVLCFVCLLLEMDALLSLWGKKIMGMFAIRDSGSTLLTI